MRLRSKIEELLPLKPGEVALSPEARKAVFRGFYFHTSKVVQVSDLSGYQNNGGLISVVRSWRGGYPHSSFHHTETTPEGADAFKDQKALERASDVERVARRIKAALVLVLAAAGVVGGLNASGTFSSQEVPTAVSSTMTTPIDSLTLPINEIAQTQEFHSSSEQATHFNS